MAAYVLAQGHGVEAPPGTVGRLYPGVQHEVDVAVGVALPRSQVRHPGRLHLQAALLCLCPSPPRPGHRHPGEVLADLVRLAAHHRLQGRRHHRVLGRHHRQALRVVHHYFHEAQRRPLGAAGADGPFYLAGGRVPSFHPRLQLPPAPQHSARQALPAPPGAHLYHGLVALAVVRLGPPVALLEVLGRPLAAAPVEVHPALHRDAPAVRSGAPHRGGRTALWAALSPAPRPLPPGPRCGPTRSLRAGVARALRQFTAGFIVGSQLAPLSKVAYVPAKVERMR